MRETIPAIRKILPELRIIGKEYPGRNGKRPELIETGTVQYHFTKLLRKFEDVTGILDLQNIS